MKKHTVITMFLALSCALPLAAQQSRRSAAAAPAVATTGDYATDVGVVQDAQSQALDQAKQMVDSGAPTADSAALATAIKEMERSQAALEEAKKSPDKLTAAVAAEQSAYQALLKALPREYRVSRSRSRSQRGANSGSSGQPSDEELNQLDLTSEENRYENERQASAAPTPQQSEQAQTVDRLKQLARRQQDMNDRLRDLQTALQEARTEQERQEAQLQLKRLRDEEKQMLSDVDELRQQMEQSPNSSQQADARQQLEQTRNDVQKAGEQLDNQSVSEALASGSRAEENLQNLRENLRQQTSSQFTQQMRQLQSQARDLASQEEQIGRDLNALNNAPQKPLDDSAQRRALAEQMTSQESALTNLLGGMKNVTEQAETTEPLLAKQLYDILRRQDQAHTDSQLDIGAQLVDRGFLPQASATEQAARTNINELRQNVESAAQSVLGSEADALRYAQKELDDLSSQLARELAAGTNSTASGNGTNSSGQGRRDAQTGARGRGAGQDGMNSDTNDLANADSAGREGQAQAGGERQGRDGQAQGRGQGRDGNQAQGEGQRGDQAQAGGQRGQRGEQGRNGERGQAGGEGQNGETAQAGDQTQTGDDQNAQENARGGGRGRGARGQNNRGGAGGGNSDQAQQPGDGADGGRDQLRRFAEQLGRGGRGGPVNNGPITGTNYMDWVDRLRDVEQTVDSQDIRNQLATVRERVGVYRGDYRRNGRLPAQDHLQKEVIEPLKLAREWVDQELSRAQKDRSLVPLDRDAVQDKYSEAVREYYEKLGNPQ